MIRGQTQETFTSSSRASPAPKATSEPGSGVSIAEQRGHPLGSVHLLPNQTSPQDVHLAVSNGAVVPGPPGSEGR